MGKKCESQKCENLLRVIHANSSRRIRLRSSSNFFFFHKLDINSKNIYFLHFSIFFLKMFISLFNFQQTNNMFQHRNSTLHQDSRTMPTTLILVDLASASSKIHQPLIAPHPLLSSPSHPSIRSPPRNFITTYHTC